MPVAMGRHHALHGVRAAGTLPLPDSLKQNPAAGLGPGAKTLCAGASALSEHDEARVLDTAFGRFCNEVRPVLTNVQKNIVHEGGVEGSLAAMWAKKSAKVRAALVPLAPQCSLL